MWGRRCFCFAFSSRAQEDFLSVNPLTLKVKDSRHPPLTQLVSNETPRSFDKSPELPEVIFFWPAPGYTRLRWVAWTKSNPPLQPMGPQDLSDPEAKTANVSKSVCRQVIIGVPQWYVFLGQ